MVNEEKFLRDVAVRARRELNKRVSTIWLGPEIAARINPAWEKTGAVGKYAWGTDQIDVLVDPTASGWSIHIAFEFEGGTKTSIGVDRAREGSEDYSAIMVLDGSKVVLSEVVKNVTVIDKVPPGRVAPEKSCNTCLHRCMDMDLEPFCAAPKLLERHPHGLTLARNPVFGEQCHGDWWEIDTRGRGPRKSHNTR